MIEHAFTFFDQDMLHKDKQNKTGYSYINLTPPPPPLHPITILLYNPINIGSGNPMFPKVVHTRLKKHII